MNTTISLADEVATQRLGECLAINLKAPLVIMLSGDLGTGKTTLVRALINRLSPGTRVKSPTYTLIESYPLADFNVQHMDLYRLQSPDELHALGMDDLVTEDAVVIIEWPEKGAGLLPPADLTLELRHEGMARTCLLSAQSPAGSRLLDGLRQSLCI